MASKRHPIERTSVILTLLCVEVNGQEMMTFVTQRMAQPVVGEPATMLETVATDIARQVAPPSVGIAHRPGSDGSKYPSYIGYYCRFRLFITIIYIDYTKNIIYIDVKTP